MAPRYFRGSDCTGTGVDKTRVTQLQEQGWLGVKVALRARLRPRRRSTETPLRLEVNALRRGVKRMNELSGSASGEEGTEGSSYRTRVAKLWARPVLRVDFASLGGTT